MNLQAESDRLYKLYDEKDNETLLHLLKSRADLTDAAQEALDRVMRERGLQAPAQTTAKPIISIASEDDLDADEASLWTFGDMFQANRAVQVLEQSEIPYRLIDHSRSRNVARGSSWLELVVRTADHAAAKALLQAELRLFPEPETGAQDPSAGTLDDLIGLFIFDADTEMPQGLAAARALAEAGISFLWHDGRDSPEGLADEKTIAIEVKQASYDRANAIVEAAIVVL